MRVALIVTASLNERWPGKLQLFQRRRQGCRGSGGKILSDISTISTTLETTFVRRRNRARKWRMLLLSCSMGTVRSLPVKS